LQAYQEFRAVHELLESSKFEPGGELRRKLESISSDAQRLLLYLLAVIQHRADLRPEAVPETIRVASSNFRALFAGELQTLAARAIGPTDRPNQDLQGALVALEQAVASQIGAIADASIVEQVRARFDLYQAAVPIVSQMAGQMAE
jgi:hypothetical protein